MAKSEEVNKNDLVMLDLASRKMMFDPDYGYQLAEAVQKALVNSILYQPQYLLTPTQAAMAQRALEKLKGSLDERSYQETRRFLSQFTTSGKVRGQGEIPLKSVIEYTRREIDQRIDMEAKTRQQQIDLLGVFSEIDRARFNLDTLEQWVSLGTWLNKYIDRTWREVPITRRRYLNIKDLYYDRTDPQRVHVFTSSIWGNSSGAIKSQGIERLWDRGKAVSDIRKLAVLDRVKALETIAGGII
jgi:hypothetical protein